MRPVEEVIEELRLLGRHIMFMDDNLTADKDYAKDLFARMVPLNKRWCSQCGIDIAYNDELLRLAYGSGCRGVFIGLESLYDENLRRWGKGNKAGDYLKAIGKLHAAGIAVFTGIVLGYDCDSPGVFRDTLDFLYEAKVDALQATVFTPFPGTPLFDEMDKQGRIVEKDWAKYDFRHVVFEPRNMSRETLKKGHDWVLSGFYSRRAVLRRLVNQLAYLDASTVAYASALNFGYRTRLKADGTFISLSS